MIGDHRFFSTYETPSIMYVLHCRSTYADGARQFLGRAILSFVPAIISAPRKPFGAASQPIKQEKKGNVPNPRAAMYGRDQTDQKRKIRKLASFGVHREKPERSLPRRPPSRKQRWIKTTPKFFFQYILTRFSAKI